MVKHTQTICWQIADELFDHFVGWVLKRLRLVVDIKNFQDYIKLPWDKFVGKKRPFRKIFYRMPNILQLQCLDDDLVIFLELLMFINAYIQCII